MANTESKRSIRKKAISSQQSAVSQSKNPTKTKTSNKPHRILKFKSGGRGSHRFADARGKTLDFVEFYTSGDFHCLDVRFQDHTALTFTIEPRFTVEAEHADWKTGDMRRLRQWAPIESAGF